MYRTRGSDPASRGLGKAGPTWLTFTTGFSICWIKERLSTGFSEVFDTVSHSILLEKLAAHGLERCFSLGEELAGVKEWWWMVLVGFSQGSVLEPVEFHFLIDDLEKGIGCVITQFANDTKLVGND